MKKYAYLAKLEELLAALPEQEREDALSYYEEYIDAAGKENEQQTLAALGSPEEVAQKILEGEGLAEEAAPAAGADPAAQAPEGPTLTLGDEPAAPAPEPSGLTPPAGPEPPRPGFGSVDDEPPAPHKKGFLHNPPKPFSQRGWIIFWVVIGAAALIQAAILLWGFLGIRPFGGTASSTSTVVDSGSETAPDTSSFAVFEEDEVTVLQEAPPTPLVEYSTSFLHEGSAHSASTEHGTVHDSVTVDGRPTRQIFDTEVEEVELDLHTADVVLVYDAASEGLAIQIDGEKAANFEGTYIEHDGRRVLRLHDTRHHEVSGSAAEIVVTLPSRVGRVKVSLETGDVTTDGMHLDTLDVCVDTGDIVVNAVSVNEICLETKTGDIDLVEMDFTTGRHKIDLKSGCGDIFASIRGSREDFAYELKTRVGDIWLDNDLIATGGSTGSAASGAGHHGTLQAAAGVGDITVDFAS